MAITLTMNEVDTLVAAGPTACYEYLLKYQGPQYLPETARRRDAVAEWAGVAPDSVDIFLRDGRECFRVGEIDVRVMTEAEADSALGDIRTFREYQFNLHSKVDYVFIAGFLDSDAFVEAVRRNVSPSVFYTILRESLDCAETEFVKALVREYGRGVVLSWDSTEAKVGDYYIYRSF